MKKLFIIIFTILTIILLLVSIVILSNKINNRKTIEYVYEILEENNIQENEDTNLVVNLGNTKDIIGIIKIDKISFEGIIYNGTDLKTLDKGVGHFENTPIINGNVCLAAHNNNKFWAKLNTLQKGDKIIYTTLLGTKEYHVNKVTIINETDWSLLENTNENILTLITCVKGKPLQRLCVQCIEAK